jgi:hypothetical protein
MIKTATLLLLLAAVLIAAPAHAEDMSFRAIALGSESCGARCELVVAAEGEIVEGTPGAFLSFVRQNVGGGKLHGVVLLDSPGGKVVASMELGRTLRRLGMSVIVARPAAESADLAAGRCYSACVYALMGGLKRVIPPQSQVGIHRMFNYSMGFALTEGGLFRERNYDDGGMLEMLSRYSSMMGVSAELVNLAERTSSDRLYMLSGAEIARWRLGSRKL